MKLGPIHIFLSFISVITYIWEAADKLQILLGRAARTMDDWKIYLHDFSEAANICEIGGRKRAEINRKQAEASRYQQKTGRNRQSWEAFLSLSLVLLQANLGSIFVLLSFIYYIILGG